MINQHAIQQLENHFENFDLAATLFGTIFENNVQRFLELKHMLHEVDVSRDKRFQKQFGYFYGVQRMSREAKTAYFTRFEQLKETDGPIDVRELTEEMAPALGKRQFSFCSKMANLIEDDTYPIYDRYVATVFHRPGLGYGMDYKTHLYQDLCDTYRSLKNHPLVAAFRERFHAEDMGYMKVLDALFWFVGNSIETERRLNNP